MNGWPASPPSPLFWQGLLQVTLVASIALGLNLALRRFSAPLRYGLLLLALAKFAVPVVPAPMGVFPWLGERLEWSAVQDGDVFLPPASDTISATAAAPAEMSGTVEPREAGAGPWAALWLLYGLGVLVGASRLVSAGRSLARRRRAARPCEDERGRRLYHEAARALGVGRLPELRLEPHASTPVAFGILRPTVMVPEALLSELDDTALKAVLAHELGHHRRGDLWVLTLQRVLGVLWWPNPIFHWLDHELRRVREQCCDDFVLSRRLVEAGPYCRALIDTADLCAASRASVPALAAAGSLEPLGQRLQRLLDGRSVRRGELGGPAFLLLAAIAVVVLPGRALQADVPVAGAPAAGAPVAGAPAPVSAVEREVNALQELEIRHVWPRYLLRTLIEGGGLELDELRLDGGRFVVGLYAAGPSELVLGAMATTVDRSSLELQRMTKASPGSWHATLGITAEGAEVVRTSTAEEEKALLAKRYLHVDDNVGAIARGLQRVTVDTSGVTLKHAKPGRVIDFAYHREWPLTLEVEGPAEKRLALLSRYARFPGVVLHAVDSPSDRVTRVEMRLLAQPAARASTEPLPDGRQFDVSGERLRAVSNTLAQAVLAPPS